MKITGASYIHIPLAHSAILVLTGEEYARAVLRGKVEQQTAGIRGELKNNTFHKSRQIRDFADYIERLELSLAGATEERDLLREVVKRLGELLMKEEAYRDTLVEGQMLPFDWAWPPQVKQVERYGLDGVKSHERLVPDPKWASA